jgi:hypothetical protein
MRQQINRPKQNLYIFITPAPTTPTTWRVPFTAMERFHDQQKNETADQPNKTNPIYFHHTCTHNAHNLACAVHGYGALS